MEENMKMQAKNKAEHTKFQHEQKMSDAKSPAKKKLKKNSEEGEYEQD
jgi:hypothetical protein